MKFYVRFCLFSFFSSILFGETFPLIDRFFHHEDMGHTYSRGIYMIVLADESLENILKDEATGNFIKFKKTQGYDVEVINYENVGGTVSALKSYLDWYSSENPLLEYVLLIGDVNGSYVIPPHTTPSYNESEYDVTDYPYTYFSEAENAPLNPRFMIGRWPIRTQDDLKKIKKRSIQYVLMDYVTDYTFLNNALLVAGNFSDAHPSSWPVTPVWTSRWLMDELNFHGYAKIDTAFFHLGNQQIDNPLISSSWNDGVGIINYRGWGDANGWHKPYFHRENIDPGLNNGWRLPIVMSFVCNTGDFGNDFGGSGLDKSFGEVLITGGSINNPKGAAAMIGPSDLDTDTRFNNVLCAVIWDELLEGRVPELGPALHAGKQSLLKEFGGLEVNGPYGPVNIVNFYHKVYSVIGDPSLPVWLEKPRDMDVDLDTDLHSSHLSTIIVDKISDEPLMDVVGVLLFDGEIIGKGLSNALGELNINFSNLSDNSQIEFYLNKPQYHQKKMELNFVSDDDDEFLDNQYEIPSNDHEYEYSMTIDSDGYDWIELGPEGEHDDLGIDFSSVDHRPGINLGLLDDTLTRINLGFSFQYYGHSFDSITICSNGWASFMPCLQRDSSEPCNEINYFFNNSISHPLGPYAMLAPFFDDLDDNLGTEDFDVYYWSNGADSLIIEWHDIANGQTDENCPDCVKETFQLILDGNNVSEVGDGQIVFNYLEIHDIDDHGCTVGIESPDKNHGVEFLFNKTYFDENFNLDDGMTIRFTSEMTYIPGCMDQTALNYNSNVTDDDGSCEYEEGCMDPIALNYNSNAIIDDWSCEYPPCETQLGDLNGDGEWNVLDVIALVNCIFNNNCNVIENGCSADINDDNEFNVMDVVALANCILNANCN